MKRAFLRLAGEGARYLIASGLAFALDFGAYVALIRLGDVHYLVAAPIAFLLGLALVYVLSVRWVFANRRLADERSEFAIFAAIGVLGVALNQVALYYGVEHAGLSYEAAKIASAVLVFCTNYVARKLLLFTAW